MLQQDVVLTVQNQRAGDGLRARWPLQQPLPPTRYVQHLLRSHHLLTKESGWDEILCGWDQSVYSAHQLVSFSRPRILTGLQLHPMRIRVSRLHLLARERSATRCILWAEGSGASGSSMPESTIRRLASDCQGALACRFRSCIVSLRLYLPVSTAPKLQKRVLC